MKHIPLNVKKKPLGESLKDIFTGKSESAKRVSIDVPVPYLKLLKKLEDYDFLQPVLFGGALRNLYMGKRLEETSDLDILVVDKYARPNYDMQYYSTQTVKSLNLLKGLEVTGSDAQYRFADADIQAEYEIEPGRIIKIDFALIQNDENNALASKNNVKTVAMLGDAPINSIAMNAKGEIWAHPLFREHADKKVFKFLDRDSQQYDKDMVLRNQSDIRFDKLKSQIPDLERL